MKRRTFLGGLAAGGSFLLTRSLFSATAQKPPNILWIMTDQQFADAMSCAGCLDVATPSMDWIAAHGVRFEKAYCTNPLCTPSRASMITGRYPHELGITNNRDGRGLETPSVGAMVKQAGYRTGYVGKWHIPMPNDDEKWHGFDFIRHALPNGIDPLVAPSSIEFLSASGSEPWFLVSSFVNPHDICEWARMADGMEDKFKNGAIPPAPPPDQCPALPANFGIPANEPSVIRQLQNNPAAVRTYPVKNWDEEKWRQYRWAYYRLIEKVDAEIGKILSSLESSGQLENTVIMFLSDHGDGMGAHKWNQKTLFYEECARVPFIVAGHGVDRPGRTDKSTLVSTGIDLAATILDYAGANPQPSYHGLSLRSVAEGRGAPQRDLVVSENALTPGENDSGNVFGRMARTDRFKYVVFSEGEHPEQLFDLQEDPGEMRNLAETEEYLPVLKMHRDLLRSHLLKTSDPFIAKALG